MHCCDKLFLLYNGFVCKNVVDASTFLRHGENKMYTYSKPKCGIILAAGYGMRMVPINTEYPKGLLEIHGQPLIERLIQQLQNVGVEKIIVVVGFMKEEYEYLIDTYHVELVFNSQYHSFNNLYSLYLVKSYLSDAYILPCDIWCKSNPFSSVETESWYMVTEKIKPNSNVLLKEDGRLEIVAHNGNAMIGIAYLTKQDAEKVASRLEFFVQNGLYLSSFWEDSLISDDKYLVRGKKVSSKEVFEINTYEELRELDKDSNQLNSDAIDTICEALNTDRDRIVEIQVLKKGMTNRSFLFNCNGGRYIMRIPGEGTDMLINRSQEAIVYQAVLPYHICDDVVYINPANGYKISRFIENSRNCDAFNGSDVEKCMDRLRELHQLNLQVPHKFDIFKQIDVYEGLWNGKKSVYKDYQDTKKNVLSLKKYIETHIESYCLTHIDAVADNFLIRSDGSINLIDWEYAGMQDPHVDIAMFCIYSMYDRKHIDKCIDYYFHGECNKYIRIKIYCYIAACGLLWSNWCEYKRSLGIEFGEYSMKQYRYAKEYYRIAVSEMEKEKLCIK